MMPLQPQASASSSVLAPSTFRYVIVGSRLKIRIRGRINAGAHGDVALPCMTRREVGKLLY